MISSEVGVVDFPTIGEVGDAWITQHCRVPDGFARGKPFVKADWQYWVHANRYRVREDVKFVDPSIVAEMLEAIAGGSEETERITNEDLPSLNQAFEYRRTMTVGPQKTGKGPNSATEVAFEACGPSVFAGIAEGGEVYSCDVDGNCRCGWEYPYDEGQAMGMRHPSPLIQITATNEDQTDNIFRPLRAMITIQGSPLKQLMRARGNFVRIIGLSEDEELDRVDAVTASANARLGNPISDAEQDEAGLYTKSNKLLGVAHTQNRGAAGMGGRTHITTNAWDPTQNSYAQQQHESGAKDIFVFYRDPALESSLWDGDGRPLSFTLKANRRKIFKYVYEGSWWVNLDSIEAECMDVMKVDPAQAERFFGNRRVQGAGSWLPEGLWDSAYAVA